jgi:hypothetical protein
MLVDACQGLFSILTLVTPIRNATVLCWSATSSRIAGKHQPIERQRGCEGEQEGIQSSSEVRRDGGDVFEMTRV